MYRCRSRCMRAPVQYDRNKQSCTCTLSQVTRQRGQLSEQQLRMRAMLLRQSAHLPMDFCVKKLYFAQQAIATVFERGVTICVELLLTRHAVDRCLHCMWTLQFCHRPLVPAVTTIPKQDGESPDMLLQQKQRVWRLIGAMCVLGGHFETLRENCTVWMFSLCLNFASMCNSDLTHDVSGGCH